MIRGEPSTKIIPRPTTTTRGFTFSIAHEADPSLVVRSTSGVIDFNRSILGDTGRKLDSRRFQPTLIQREGIFGFPSEYKTRSYDNQPTYSEFILKKLFKPAVANKILCRSEEYFDLIQELLKWVDKKGNDYPIDPIRGRKSLEPRTQRAATKMKLEEDHMYQPGYRRLGIRPQMTTKYTGKADLGAMTKKLMTSAYTDGFCDDSHNEWLTSTPVPTASCKPIQNPTPWAYFPGNPFERDDYAPDAYIYEQARENRISGKMNRDIFNSKTCL